MCFLSIWTLFFFFLRRFPICMDRCDTGNSDKEMIHSATSLSPKHDRVQRQCQQMAVLYKHWAYQTHRSQPWSTNSSRDLTLVRCPLLSWDRTVVYRKSVSLLPLSLCHTWMSINVHPPPLYTHAVPAIRTLWFAFLFLFFDFSDFISSFYG